MRSTLLIFLLALAISISSGFIVSNSEWESYKDTYGKVYRNVIEEKLARFYYAFNKGRIDSHNSRYERNRESYRLDVNQFSDKRFLEFGEFFPPTVAVQSNGVPYTAPIVAPQATFSYGAQGFTSPVQNQGLVCNSGWAYATAAALQIYDAVITGNLNSQALSAQNLIDCAGGTSACRNQVPQTAFDYLTRELQKIYPQVEYRNNPQATQGMCVPPVASTNGKSLRSYSNIADGNDDLLMRVINYVSPVVIKFNPSTFEFMHYKEGMFTQPKPTVNGAHYMTVVGYETDTRRGKDVWLVQNSFGTTWGEGGMIRIERNAAKPIAHSAIFPSA